MLPEVYDELGTLATNQEERLFQQAPGQLDPGVAAQYDGRIAGPGRHLGG